MCVWGLRRDRGDHLLGAAHTRPGLLDGALQKELASTLLNTAGAPLQRGRGGAGDRGAGEGGLGLQTVLRGWRFGPASP